MKKIYIILLFVLGCFSVGTVVAQQQNADVNKMVLMNDTVIAEIYSFYPPTVKARSEDDNGALTIQMTASGTYEVTYVADSDYIGYIDFTIECIPAGFPPAPEYVNFNLEYIKSYVRADHDFIWYAGGEIDILPLQNDSTSVGESELRSINQVMYGDAQLIGDTIRYTGLEGVKRDFITYNVIDTNGVFDAATVYISYAQEDVSSYEEEVIFAAVGSKELIILDDQDYELDSEPSLGTTRQLASHAYEYTSNVEGVDSLYFNKEDAQRLVIVNNVVEDLDLGIVRDDIFFTAQSTTLEFNVFENDLSGQFVVTDYSSELIYLGNGNFSYTPSSGEEGIRFFSYTIDTGSGLETGEIRLIVKNFDPVHDFTYEFSTKENSELVISYDVPINTYQFHLVTNPEHGIIEIIDSGDIELTCETLFANNNIIYTPYNNFVGNDFFEVEYCASLNAECVTIPVSVSVGYPTDDCDCVNNCIWAGDANNDGKVSILDMLTINRNIGAAGLERDVEDHWKGVEGSPFEFHSAYDRNVMYADSDGDGNISTDDIDLVESNLGKYHSFISNDALGVQELPFYYTTNTVAEGDDQKVILTFYAGSEQNPVVNMDGIAFRVHLPSDMVDSSTVALSVQEDNFFVKNSPFVANMTQPEDGDIRVVIAKTSDKISNGFGQLATLEFIIEDEVIGIRPDLALRREDNQSIHISLEDAVVTSSEGFVYNLASRSSVLRLEDNTGASEISNKVYLYPNPAYDHFYIDTNSEIISVQVLTPFGEKVLESNDRYIETLNLESGLYLIRINTPENSILEKIEVIR